MRSFLRVLSKGRTPCIVAGLAMGMGTLACVTPGGSGAGDNGSKEPDASATERRDAMTGKKDLAQPVGGSNNPPTATAGAGGSPSGAAGAGGFGVAGSGVDANSPPTVVDAGPIGSSDALADPGLTGKPIKRRTDEPNTPHNWKIPTLTKPITIGARAAGAAGFNGVIDRIRFYNVAVSDADIIAHAQGKLEPCTSSPECVGDWTFEKLENGAFPSTGPKALPAKPVGDVPLVDGTFAGTKGIDIQMDGTKAKSWVEIPVDPSLQFKDEFTVEIWLNFTNNCKTCASYTVFEYEPGGLEYEVHGGAMVIRGNTGVTVDGRLSFPQRGWHHYAVTFSKNQIREFKDANLTADGKPAFKDDEWKIK